MNGSDQSGSFARTNRVTVVERCVAVIRLQKLMSKCTVYFCILDLDV